MRSYKTRKKNNLILGALAIVLITMAVGYSIFSSNLNITGTSNISNNWDIRISKVEGTLGGQAKHALDTNENEINPECDSTTNNPKSCGEGLTVTFSDLFYYEGDSSTYTITLKNSGSLDASLTQNVEPVITSNSDKIKVELEGFKTKGQILAKNDTQTTTLTITYLSETALADTNNKIKPLSNTKTITPRLLDNEEQQPEVSITITYPFVQDSESGAVTSEKHLVEYDCETNGGTSCTNYKEYVTTGQAVKLDNEGTEKEKYAFLGWNTDKDAETGLDTLTMGNNDIKLYAIYKKDKITFNSVTTTSTTNSITVVASASALSEIVKYEYSTDGETYYEGSIDTANNNSTYTFTGLNQNTSYPIYVKATTKSGISDVYEVSGVDLTENVVTEGDGLYKDETEPDRYIYKGANPNNYLTFNGEKAGWRIYSIENDGSIKIVKHFDNTESIPTRVFDANDASRQIGYCASYGYCNAWAATTNLVGTPSAFTNGSYSGTVSADSQILTYLNSNTSGNYYYSLTDTAKGQIVAHDWNVGPAGTDNDAYTLSKLVSSTYEGKYKWNGKVGLLTKSEYMRASSNSSCVTANYWYNQRKSTTCNGSDYLFNSITNWWLLSPYSDTTFYVFLANSGSYVYGNNANGSNGVRPALYLKSGLNIKGSGTSNDPYYIGNPGIDTQTLQTPTFSEEETDNGKRITIDYHRECGSNGITCTYIKDGETTENLTGSTQTVDYTEDGTLVATISDGTNTVSTSSYTVKMPPTAERTIQKLGATVVTSGDGLYQDSTETDRYIYKGANPNNYIQFNGETWRIYSIESDGSLKITRSDLLTSRAFDARSARPTASNSYCDFSSSYGCNAWAANSNLTSKPSSFVNGSKSGTVSADSRMLTYLNSDTSGNYYNGLTSTTKGQIVAHDWNVGPAGTYNDEYTLSQLVSNTYEGKYKWNGKVGLLTKSEYMRASSNSSCVTAKYWYDTYSNKTCANTDYLYNSSTHWWLLSPESEYSYTVFIAHYGGLVDDHGAYGGYGVRPALYLKANLTITGSGTNDSNIYKIS